MRYIIFFLSIIVGIGGLLSITEMAFINYEAENISFASGVILFLVFLLFLIYVLSCFGFVNKKKPLLKLFVVASLLLSVGYVGKDVAFNYNYPFSLVLQLKNGCYSPKDNDNPLVSSVCETSVSPLLMLSKPSLNLNSYFSDIAAFDVDVVFILFSLYAMLLYKKVRHNE